MQVRAHLDTLAMRCPGVGQTLAIPPQVQEGGKDGCRQLGSLEDLTMFPWDCESGQPSADIDQTTIDTFKREEDMQSCAKNCRLV